MFQLRRQAIEVVELEHFHDDGAVFLPGLSPASLHEGAARVTGIDALRVLLVRLAGVAKPLVTGHHASLSRERAQGVAWLLSGNRDAWCELALGVAVPADKAHLRAWLPIVLPTDDDGWTVETWHDVWDAYMALLAPTAPPPVAIQHKLVVRTPEEEKESIYPVKMAEITWGWRSAARAEELEPLNPQLCKGHWSWRSIGPGDEIVMPETWPPEPLLARGFKSYRSARRRTSRRLRRSSRRRRAPSAAETITSPRRTPRVLRIYRQQSLIILGNKRQLGDGTTTERLVPRRVAGLPRIIEIEVVEGSVFAVAADGSLWCWGDNRAFVLGDGTQIERHVPVRVPGLTNVAHVTLLSQYTCALLRDGTPRCWGVVPYESPETRWLPGSGGDNYMPHVPRAGRLPGNPSNLKTFVDERCTLDRSGTAECDGRRMDHVKYLGSECVIRDDDTVWSWEEQFVDLVPGAKRGDLVQVMERVPRR